MRVPAAKRPAALWAYMLMSEYVHKPLHQRALRIFFALFLSILIGSYSLAIEARRRVPRVNLSVEHRTARPASQRRMVAWPKLDDLVIASDLRLDPSTSLFQPRLVGVGGAPAALSANYARAPCPVADRLMGHAELFAYGVVGFAEPCKAHGLVPDLVSIQFSPSILPPKRRRRPQPDGMSCDLLRVYENGSYPLSLISRRSSCSVA